MRRYLLVLLICATAAAADLTGKWVGGPFEMTLQQEGDRLTGIVSVVSGEKAAVKDGKIGGGRVTFLMGEVSFELKMEDGRLKGSAKIKPQVVFPVVLERAAATAGPAVFEVASVKRSTGNGRGLRLRYEPGRLTIAEMPLQTIVMHAYDLKLYQFEGPAWMATERYEITAKHPPGWAIPQIMEALRTLLAERFHLVARRETKEMAVYALVVAKGGLKMKEAEIGMGDTRIGKGTLRATRTSMASFAGALNGQVDRPVIDQTGLTGVYDVDLQWSTEGGLTADLFSAMERQLGLKLEARKAPVEMVTVERADKVPVEN